MLAVELFETRDGRVLVNELAMRPHNSATGRIDGAVTSQFENHLRAVLDLPLGAPRAARPWTVMVNILGGDAPGHCTGAYPHCLARDPGLHVHLYGKDVRPGPQGRPRQRSTATTSTTARAGAPRRRLPDEERSMNDRVSRCGRAGRRSSWGRTPTGR